MIHGIHHTAISTGNMERALAFYRDLLGMEVDFDTSFAGDKADQITALDNAAARIVMLNAGNARIELFEFTAPTPQPSNPQRPVCDHGLTHICLQVSDIDGEYQRLADAGVTFHCPPLQLGRSRATYGRDPDGNVFELLETTHK